MTQNIIIFQNTSTLSVVHLVKILLVISSPVNFAYDYFAFKSGKECRCVLSVKIHINSIKKCFFSPPLDPFEVSTKYIHAFFLWLLHFSILAKKKSFFSKLIWSFFHLTVKREAFFCKAAGDGRSWYF